MKLRNCRAVVESDIPRTVQLIVCIMKGKPDLSAILSDVTLTIMVATATSISCKKNYQNCEVKSKW